MSNNVRTADLSVLAYANNFTLWHYKCRDADALLSTNYFKPAHDMLREGDLIICSPSITSMSPFFIYVKDVQKELVVVGPVSAEALQSHYKT